MSADVNDHEIWRERAAIYALDALTGDERREFETHLQSCLECAAELLTLRPAADALAQTVPQLDPRPELRDRVMSAVIGETRTAMPAAAPAPSMPAARVTPKPSPLRWLPIAAILALAVGLGVYANGLRGRVSRLESELDQARAQSAALQARVGRAETTLASTETQLTSTQSQLAVLAAPDSRRVTLAAQIGAPPGASGRADWSPSRGLALSVSNLPAPLPMRDYQVWLLTRGAPPVSAGLLPRDAVDGRTVVFTAPAGAREPIGVALSEEPEGGVPQPGKQIYLVGMMARAQ
jgi:anti-sigma-K factor RskA